MIDLRMLDDIPGLSNDRDRRAQQPTRFYWMRCCEHCLSRTTSLHRGITVCGGCGRAVVGASAEDEPPT